MSDKMKMHPAAECLPMMDEDELSSLVADIVANGLQESIKTIEYEGEQAILDGRNRFKACELAGIEPRFEQVNGVDPRQYVRSHNIERRQIKKGQKAMAMAFLYPEPEKGGRGKKSKALETKGFSEARLSQARAVLAFSPALAEDVLKDKTPLDEALKQIKAGEQQSDSKEARMERLRRDAPDLAALAADDRMTWNEAFAAFDERQRQEASIREGGRSAANRLGDFCSWIACIDQAMKLGETNLLNSERVAGVVECTKHLQRLLKQQDES
jgi:ParB-like chromosome segregation protein Spo0J